MLWGKEITVYTYHKNQTQDALGLTSDHMYRLILVLEDYGPTIVYNKGIQNIIVVPHYDWTMDTSQMTGEPG